MSGLETLNDKIAVVTGGASGIGRGIAEHLIAQGMQVVISDIEQGVLQRTANELGIEGIPADVSKSEDVQALAENVVERYGTVHVAVNNAGVGSMGRIADLRLDDWRWMINVNLFGVIHGVAAFLPILKANADGGHIVNTASMAGLYPIPNMGAYTAAKSAVVGLTEVLAMELAEEGSLVGASVLCPGPVKSNIKSSLRTRPGGDAGGLFDVDASKEGPLAALRWMEPREVGKLVEKAILARDLHIITHPELGPMFAQHIASIEKAFN